MADRGVRDDPYIPTCVVRPQAPRVHTLAPVSRPTRDWAATLPSATQASADWDRCFMYAWMREPSLPPGAGLARRQRLAPLHIVRVNNEAEQITVRHLKPDHLRLRFVVVPPQRRAVQSRHAAR